MLSNIAQLLHMSPNDLKDLLPLFSFLLALAIALIALWKWLRSLTSRAFIRLSDILGRQRARYNREFLRIHGEINNIYLDRREKLSLEKTFLPLRVKTADRTDRTAALDILTDKANKRILILGGPGSGKTTLLKALGAGLVAHRDKPSWLAPRVLPKHSKRGELPVYVDLRHFATYREADISLFDYISDYSLRDQMHLGRPDVFLRRLLARQRCLLLLDGLDEVGDDLYPGVLTRVSEFCAGAGQAASTENARVVLTCRQENFFRLRDDWIPGVFAREHVIAPLHDAEILTFIQKRRADFPSGRTPEGLYEQVRNSDMTDLHRTPLLLTISIGLYINVPGYEIPRSISRFYETMVRDLLQRHDFRSRSGVLKVNKFVCEDKYRLLREFAVAVAELHPQTFYEFSYSELREFLQGMVGRLEDLSVNQIDDFLREIVFHSGLLTRVSDEEQYAFAHRSIHEYFAAVQLQRTPGDSVNTLIGHASDSLWQQILIFFAALDHTHAETFVRQLSAVSPELACRCLPGMQVLDERLGREVVKCMYDQISRKGPYGGALAALVCAASCQNEVVTGWALKTIRRALSSRHTGLSSSLVGLGRADTLDIIASLSNTSEPRILRTCISLTETLDDGVDLIGPLWRCLRTAWEAGNSALSATIVRRLLAFAMTDEGVRVIQAQPRFAVRGVTDDERLQVYPFSQGLDRESNLVTLLVLADKTNTVVEDPNFFLVARKNASPDLWRRVEKDRARRVVALEPYYLGFILSLLGFVGPVLSLAYVYSAMLHPNWPGALTACFPLTRISGLYWLYYALAGGCCVFALMSVMSGLTRVLGNPEGSPHLPFRWFGNIASDRDDVGVVFLIGFVLFWVIACPCLAGVPLYVVFQHAPLWFQLAVVPIVCAVLYCAPVLVIFQRGVRLFLVRPNPCIDVYHDPRSRIWIVPDPQGQD